MIQLITRLKELVDTRSNDDLSETLTALATCAEESPERQTSIGENSIFEIIKSLISLELVTTSKQCECLLLLAVRLARRTMEKSTANRFNISRLCEEDLLHPLIELIAKNIAGDPLVSRWGCWLFAVLSSDSTENQLKLDAAGATIVTVIALQEHKVIYNMCIIISDFHFENRC